VWTQLIAWSPFGGRLAYGDVISNGQSAGNNGLHTLVPAPTADKLQSITKSCAQSNVLPQLTNRLTTKQWSAFTNDVKAMSKDQVPPACAADLIAVANALQSTP